MSDIELKEAFAVFDPTNSGTIQPKAFQDALAATYPSLPGQQSVTSLGNEEFARSVKIPNRPIDYKTFVELVGPAFGRPDASDDAFTVLFKSINKDGTGNISAAELKAAVRSAGISSLTEADIDEIIHEADVSGDGRMNYEEFLKIMQRSEKRLRGEIIV
ncbi:Calcium-binding protein 7 [Actinomortierella ambigua]|nr:Calcium-binding protein 7 [Actinomortierella ambigua]